MSNFKLNLPTDIPWERICVSKDMIDPIPCDSNLPPKFHSSMAVFRYDPEDEFQLYPNRLISYLKLVVTVAPYAPDINYDRAKKYLPSVLVDDLAESFPCYGAILQLTVTPEKNDLDKFSKEQFPYFVDFEPKKRELYEAVTDTGEVLSGSSNSLTVGKSSTNTESTENYNIDNGWNFGTNFTYAGTGGGFNVGDAKQVGEVNRTGFQHNNLRTSEASVERRELQSHTTHLSQMYNLFQGFHLGTNRALFFMEPRPHIRQSEVTFVNGPRALEGIQEIFLVVSRPNNMNDFCVSALLETAHLGKEPVYEYETAEDILNFRLSAIAQNKDTTWGETDWTEPKSHTEFYTPPPGYEIDLSRSGGYDIRILRQERLRRGPTVTVTRSSLSIFGEVTWRFWETGFWNDDHYANGYLDVDVTIYLRKTQPRLKEYIRKLFFSARDLCCCPQGSNRIKPWITYVTDLDSSVQVLVKKGLMNRSSFIESRLLATAIRSKMEESINSQNRANHGTVEFEQSDIYFTRISNLIAANKISSDFIDPIEVSSVLPKKTQEKIQKELGSISIGHLLKLDARKLSLSLDIPIDEALAIKDKALTEVGKKPFKRYDQNRPDVNNQDSNDNNDVEQKLRFLKELHEKGLINEELYNNCSKEIISKKLK